MTEKTPTRCPHCDSPDLFTRPKSPHLGLYCRDCGKWIKWVSQNNPIAIMPFGKYKGTKIEELPQDYLNWILENIHLNPNLHAVLSSEFERRGTTK